MKITTTLVAAIALLAGMATAQTPKHYTVTDLGTLGGTFSDAGVITDSGFIVGRASPADGTWHAFRWQQGKMTDIHTPGLKGRNSLGWSGNEAGQVVGEAETATPDPKGEDFCGFKARGLPTSGTTCLPFFWQDGVMTALPTLGGNNGVANWINNSGEVVGAAENRTVDPDCPAPQMYQFKPVIWQSGKIKELATFAGDANGLAFGINDSGQAVGTSGACTAFDPHANINLFPNHALLWQNDAITDLGSLGGAVGNIALGINNQGQVVGDSDLAGDMIFHAFLWTKASGMKDLGTLSGDVYSSASSINDKGEAVGLSLDANFNLRAVLWENGVAVDLNTLIPAKLGLFLQNAESINSRGEVIGFAATEAGDTHAFMATPAGTTAVAVPKNTTVISRQITLDGSGSFSGDGKPLTYSWSIPQGSPSAAILHGNTSTPEVQFSWRGPYKFQLTVTDSTGSSATDIATVNFEGN